MVRVRERAHPVRMRHPVVRAAVLALLRSPVHGLVDGELCGLEYVGRRTGRRIRLPVMYARAVTPAGHLLVVLVGDAAGKSWWRNFESPRAVTVRLAGRDRPGTGSLVGAGDRRFAALAQAFTRRHDLPVEPTDRLVAIRLDDRPGPAGHGSGAEPR